MERQKPVIPVFLLPKTLIMQDTSKERGRIYQQTVIGTCSKTGSAKLHDRKNALAAADMLNDRAEPFFERRDLKLMRMLTDKEDGILREQGGS